MKPILFNSDMVRAILEGHKTVTRRVVKEPWYIEDEEMSRVSGFAMHRGCNCTHGMPYPDSLYRLSDILYVRETWRVQSAHRFEADARIEFKAGGDMINIQFPGRCDQYHSRMKYDYFVKKWADDKWHPSIHMPQEAARIFLRVTDVRVERLHDITWADALKEGCERPMHFDELWNSTIKKVDRALYGWEADPWVWVIEFDRINKEDAQ